MEKRTTQSIPFHEGHEHLRKVNRSIRPAFGSRNNVSGCFLSVALEAFSITTFGLGRDAIETMQLCPSIPSAQQMPIHVRNDSDGPRIFFREGNHWYGTTWQLHS